MSEAAIVSDPAGSNRFHLQILALYPPKQPAKVTNEFTSTNAFESNESRLSIHAQRETSAHLRRGPAHPARGAARGPGPHGNQIRLRRRPMPRLHRVARRQSGSILPDRDFGGRRPQRRNDRGPGAERETASGPGSLRQGRRDAMRLLRARYDPGDGRAAQAQPDSEPGANRRSVEREYLSVLRVCKRPQSGAARRATEEGDAMKTPIREPEFTEPERYELHEGPFYHFEISRREFVHVLGAGVVLSVAVPSLFAQRASENRPTNLAQRLHIDADGVITVLTSKVEVGQGSRTQLTQAAAEELRVPVDRVRFIMADTAIVPDDGGTAGSGTTPRSVPAIRRGCAAARQLLIDTAAAAFNADAKRLSVRDGDVESGGASLQRRSLLLPPLTCFLSTTAPRYQRLARRCLQDRPPGAARILSDRLHPACSHGTARRGCRMGGWQTHRMDRHTATLARSRRTFENVSALRRR